MDNFIYETNFNEYNLSNVKVPDTNYKRNNASIWECHFSRRHPQLRVTEIDDFLGEPLHWGRHSLGILHRRQEVYCRQSAHSTHNWRRSILCLQQSLLVRPVIEEGPSQTPATKPAIYIPPRPSRLPPHPPLAYSRSRQHLETGLGNFCFSNPNKPFTRHKQSLIISDKLGFGTYLLSFLPSLTPFQDILPISQVLVLPIGHTGISAEVKRISQREKIDLFPSFILL